MQSFEWGHLIDWYRIYGRHTLPWRNYNLGDKERVYRVWLSEILLQQTQAARVVGFFDQMIEEFPTIESLARTDYDTFFPYYSGLGYYSRARNILRTASLVVNEYGGIFPNTKEALIKLPGVGPYTAEAILSFGYGIPVLSWDTNLEKVFARYYKGTRSMKLTQEEKAIIQKDLEHFLISSRLEGNESQGNGEISFEIPKRDSSTSSEGQSRKESAIYRIQSEDGNLKPVTCNLQPSLSIRDINNALMDFAALIDLKDTSNINWENYQLKNSLFYKERGANELTLTKVSRSFPTPDAEIWIILHKDHRVYYFPPTYTGHSSTLHEGNIVSDEIGSKGNTGELEKLRTGESLNQLPSIPLPSSPAHQLTPYFPLPPALVRDTREYVKQYFLNKYNLHISVRPPHEKSFTEDGKPYIVCYAQVQVGEHSFQEYKKNKGIMNNE